MCPRAQSWEGAVHESGQPRTLTFWATVFLLPLWDSLFFLYSLVGDKHSSKNKQTNKQTTLQSWKNRSEAKRNEGEVHGALNPTLTRFPKPRGQLRHQRPCLVLASHCCPLERGFQTTRAPHRFTVTSTALQWWSLAGQPPNTAGNTFRAEQGAAIGSRSKNQGSGWTQCQTQNVPVTPTLQRRKQRLRDAERPAQGYPAGKWWSLMNSDQQLNPSSQPPSPPTHPRHRSTSGQPAV